MRLYSMYYVCKNYMARVKKMTFEVRTANGKEIRSMKDWREKSKILNELANVTPICDKVRKVYESIPVLYRDVDTFEVPDPIFRSFEKAKSELLASMGTVVDLYETINPQKDQNENGGIDIMLPKFQDLAEFSECLKDLNFVITQCPYFQNRDEEIKFKTVDVGSIWLTLAVVGVSCAVLTNFGKIVDQAAKIKSHMTTVRMQEEILRSMKIKNEIAEEVTDVYKKTKDTLFQRSLNEIEKELGKLKDGEECDKVKRSLEKLGYWMDKGMQIYSSIDSPKEVRDVFPEQQELSFLPDDIQKLIEKKE